MTLLGLTRSSNARFAGTAQYGDTELIGASEDAAAEDPRRRDRDGLPGRDGGAEPGPARRQADRRADPGPRGDLRRRRPRSLHRAARARRDPARPRARRQLPARVLRRHAPARDDRARALLRPADPHRRRADDRARRHDPGADPPALPRAARADERRARPRDARPRRRRRHRRPRRRDVRRADRRAGDARRDLLRPPPPLHVGAAGIDRADGPAAAQAPADDRRAAALALQPARPAATCARAARTSSPTA